MGDVRPDDCCGKCPPIVGGGYDCTCAGNPRCKGQRVTWREKRNARKVQRLRDEYADYWDWLWYARLALRPSQIRKAEERLEKLRARRDAAVTEQGKNREEQGR